MSVATTEPHKVTNPSTGEVTVFLGQLVMKVGPKSAPQPAKER